MTILDYYIDYPKGNSANIKTLRILGWCFPFLSPQLFPQGSKAPIISYYWPKRSTIQWSASSSFAERVKFKLLGLNIFLLSQAWVFFTFEIKIESRLSILKLKTQPQVVNLFQLSLSQAWAIWSFYFTFVWRHFGTFSFSTFAFDS